MKKKLHILLAATLFLFFTCVIQVQAAEGIALNYTKTTINVGDSIHFELTGSDKTPVWTSYNENIVKINQNGEATALRTGKTTIKARVGFQYKSCTVTVVNSSIKLNKSAATIYSGGTSTNTVLLKATVKGASKTVIWETSDPSVATVDEKGRVTSVSAGAAVITATANSRTASCSLTVKESSISLNMDTLQVSTRGAGSSIKVTPVITGSKKTVKWSSSDKTVAAVSGGKITGKKTGTATITATANGVSASCNVIVTEGISINEEKVLLYAGGTKIETKQLKTNAGKKDTVIWSSSNPEAVSVSEKGLLTAVGAGTSVISAKCNGKADTCEVTVNASSTDILEDNISLKTKGTTKTYTLEKTVTGRSSSIKWTTSDKSIAAVSKGKVTAKKAGTATITATANGVSDSVTVTVANYDPTIKLNHSQYTLYTKKGNILSLKAAVDGAGKAVLWETSDTSVATITNKGKVTAVGAGNVTITATANGVSATCNIEVKETAVTLEKANIALKKGETDSLPVDITGISQSVKWSTDNSKIATVKNGVVTAENYGETDIKVTANGITSLCHVTVAEFVCEHTFDEGVITKESTCTREGTQTFTCILCGYSYTENLPLKDHEWEEYSRIEASCLVKGSLIYQCKNCTETNTEELKPMGHDWSEWQLVMPPTVTADGTEKQVCYRCQLEQERSVPKVEHTHEYISVITEPTCTDQGYTTYTCECSSSYIDDYVEATGHSAGDWEIIKDATELEEGLKMKSCTTCSEELERKTIAKLDHICSFNTLIEEQKATCTTDGFTVNKCRCGKTERETIPRTNHANRTWQTTKEASYTETGLKEAICDDCHVVVNTEVIPIVAHECQYEKVDEKQATCTESGYQTVSCSFCGASKTVTSNPIGHKEGSMSVTKQATCLESGEQTASCINCGILLKTETIPITGHSASSWITDSEAGCETNGSMHVECTVCHAELEKSTISATGHNMGGWKVESSAGCETDGTEKNSCSSCSNTETRNIPATGHSYGDWIIDREPTEEEEGLKHKECANCGNSITEDIEPIPPHVHSYSESDNTESTCTSAGSITYTCSGCGDYYSESKPVAEHTSGDWITKKEATESAEGLKVKECTACGMQTDSAVIEKLPHSHSYATDSKSPTCTEDGYEKQTCSCGSVINKVLPATGHKYGEAVVVDATCTKKGSSTITCSVCRHSEKTDIPMVEHVYVESSKTAATCTKAGNVTYTCNGCKGTKTETIAALGHDYKLTSDIAATCTAGGYTIETCSNCMDTIRTEKGEMLGHDYTDEIITKEPELGVDGEKKICCKLCGDVKEIQKIDMLLTDGTDSVYKVQNKNGEEEILIGHIDEEMSQDMYERINAYRVENGQTELAIRASFEDYTIKRAYEIAHTFEHWHPNGGGLNGSLSENIAKGATSFQADPVGVLFEAWKASDGHNRNMLGASYKNTCVKMFALKDPIHGHYIYHCVQVFSSR